MGLGDDMAQGSRRHHAACRRCGRSATARSVCVLADRRREAYAVTSEVQNPNAVEEIVAKLIAGFLIGMTVMAGVYAAAAGTASAMAATFLAAQQERAPVGAFVKLAREL